jgi:hypothetical protein
VRVSRTRSRGGTEGGSGRRSTRQWVWRLGSNPSRRALDHVQEVAAQAHRVRAALAPADRPNLIAAAWLHDVGSAPPRNKLGLHPVDGARYDRQHGQRYQPPRPLPQPPFCHPRLRPRLGRRSPGPHRLVSNQRAPTRPPRTMPRCWPIWGWRWCCGVAPSRPTRPDRAGPATPWPARTLDRPASCPTGTAMARAARMLVKPGEEASSPGPFPPWGGGRHQQSRGSVGGTIPCRQRRP